MALMAKTILFPLIVMIVAVTLACNLCEKYHITKLLSLMKSSFNWILGLLLAIFVGVISVQGFSSSVADGVAGKGVKFAVGSVIPVVGGTISDAVETVAGCSLLLKNSIGIVGLIIIVMICIIPIIKIYALSIAYKIASAIIEPIADSRIVKIISELSDILTLLGGLVIAVAVMFFIMITLIIAASNITMMMR